MVFNILANNISILLMLSILYNIIYRKWASDTSFFKIISGLLFGGFTIIGMMNPLLLAPGVIFDGRSIIISFAAFSGGPVTALITVLISSIYRLYIGGAGWLMGLLVISESALVGLIFHFLRRKNPVYARLPYLFLLGFIVHLIMLVLTVALPAELSLKILNQIAFPVLILYPVGSLLVFLLFLDSEEKVNYTRTLSISEANYRSLFENANEAIIILNKDIIFDCNMQAARMLSGRKDEITGRSMLDFSFVDADEVIENLQFRKNVARALNESGVYAFEWKGMRRDGSRFDADVKLSRIELGSQRFLQAIIRDTTQEKIAAEALKLSEERLRTLISVMPDIICFKDGEGRWLEANDFDLKLFEIDHIDYRGKKDSELAQYSDFYHDAFMKCEETDEETWKRATVSRCDEIIPRPDGSVRIFDVIKVPTFHPDGSRKSLVVVGRDITDRLRGEKELLIAKEKAEASDNLKSEFLAQMSHEIRTPVNAILSFAGLIRDELKGKIDEDLATSFTILRRAGERIIRTIDLILNMSEVQTGTYEPQFKIIDITSCSLNPLFNEFRLMAQDKNLEFNLNVKTSDTRINSDEYTVNQIFNNLIHNAIKYTHKGAVNVNVYDEGISTLVVEIADTGIGISEEYQPHLFTPFSQEEQGYSRRFEGNGLGLALVKKYCEINQAEICVESQKGKGSKFSVRFNRSV
ncbi:MAG: LytS/YhcK type 5TM receptor domain-containing protein [Bacteroidota bacterium]